MSSSNGRAVTQHLSTYLIPGVLDVATVVEPVILEHPDPQGPFGVRGMAEMPFIPTAAAIAAAIHAATGVWLDELPFTPERVWQALQTKRESNLMSTPFPLGHFGYGNIARKFSTGVAALADHTLAAVGSRTQAAADRFADEFGIPRRHASYAGTGRRPECGRHLHCHAPFASQREHPAVPAQRQTCPGEKPFAINLREAEEMVQEARTQKLFLMEAMWTRFLPLMVEVRRLIAEGAIGQLRMVQADFGFRAPFNPANRTYDPALGGGGLLDVGIYPLSLAFMVLGRPDRVVALAELGASGVDEQTGILLGFPGGELAVLSTAVATTTPWEATIMGTAGWIRLAQPLVDRPHADHAACRRKATGDRMPYIRQRLQPRGDGGSGAASLRASWRATSCRWTNPWRSWPRWMRFGDSWDRAIRWSDSAAHSPGDTSATKKKISMIIQWSKKIMPMSLRCQNSRWRRPMAQRTRSGEQCTGCAGLAHQIYELEVAGYRNLRG